MSLERLIIPFLGAALHRFGPAGGCRNTILHGPTIPRLSSESPWPAPHSPRPSRMMAGWRCGGLVGKRPGWRGFFSSTSGNANLYPPQDPRAKVWKPRKFRRVRVFGSGGRPIGVADQASTAFGRCAVTIKRPRARVGGRLMCRLAPEHLRVGHRSTVGHARLRASSPGSGGLPNSPAKDMSDGWMRADIQPGGRGGPPGRCRDMGRGRGLRGLASRRVAGFNSANARHGGIWRDSGDIA